METKAFNTNINDNIDDSDKGDFNESLRLFRDHDFFRDYLSLLRHDIRSPINTIMGFSEMLASKTTDPDHKTLAETVMSAAKKMLHLFNDFSDISTIGLSKPTESKLSLKRLLVENRHIFTDQAETKNVKIHTESTKDIYVKVDEPAVIRLIVYKTIRLALSESIGGKMFLFAEEKSSSGREKQKSETSKDSTYKNYASITITYTVSSDTENKQAQVVAVEDGIPPLLQKINGHIHIDFKNSYKDDKKRIKTISLFFPIKSIDTITGYVEIEDPENVEFDPADLVIADDDPESLELMRGMLAPYDFAIQTAENGYECYKLLLSNPPSLIITDLKMPYMSGFELLRKIKNNKDLDKIPIIAVTAHHNLLPKLIPDTQTKEPTFNGVVMKPISKKELITELHIHLPSTYRKKPKKEKDLIHKESKMEKDEEIINEKNIPYLPEILKTLENDLYPEWERISKSYIIDDIQSFASAIRDIAIKYDLSSLSVYGNSLLDQSRRFDMKNLPDTLKNFPEEIQHLKTVHDADSKQANAPKMKALVAEDNDMNRLLLERLLADMNFQVEAVSNGEAALNAFRNEKFTVVIIDAYMPELNGIDTIIAMRKEEEDTGSVYTPIIAVTGVETKSERLKFLEVGADDLIIKPFSMETLNKVLWEHIKPEDSLDALNPDEVVEGLNPSKALERAYGKKELLDDFFKLFNKNIDTVLGDIEDAFEGKDFSMLRTMAHRLKGSLIAVGADQPAETARQMELASRKILNNDDAYTDDETANLKRLLEELSEGCLTVKETIDRLLATNVE